MSEELELYEKAEEMVELTRQIDKLLEQAINYINQDRYKEAKDLILEVIKLITENEKLYNSVYEEDKEYNVMLEKALKIDDLINKQISILQNKNKGA